VLWAVIVAGSAGWGNYRHQSDVCHLYHLLTKKHGIPRENVVVMMYNDIAYNEENPHPGVIINALHGRDVYEGTMIDYMGKDVTPENFLKILEGEYLRVGSRKVLKSGPNDTVFVNFVDHGGPGVLGFPDDELHVKDLTATLEYMYNNKKYKQMLWYVEACYSGSMFAKLSPDMNITSHTASNAHESSYACVFSKKLQVYLGDCWSLNWMNNTEQIFPRLYNETVKEQYLIVKNMTNTSHASIFGDLTYIYNEPVSTFLGHPKPREQDIEEDTDQEIDVVWEESTAAPDVLLYTLRRKRAATRSVKEAQKLDRLIDYHVETELRVQIVLMEIAVEVTGSSDLAAVFTTHHQDIDNPTCNKAVLQDFFWQCYNRQAHPYITKYLHWITNLCNTYDTPDIVSAVRKTCNQEQ